MCQYLLTLCNHFQERLPAVCVMTKVVLPEYGEYVITIRMEELDEVTAHPVIKMAYTVDCFSFHTNIPNKFRLCFVCHP